MTTAADDSAVEDAFEALLAGRPAPEGSAGLAAFTEAVRTSATSPGRPNAALAELLATGLLVDQSSPSAQTARSAGTPSGSRNRIRRRTAMFFPALLAKILSAGAVAQAATGATVVVVAFAGAGAAGVLPGPVQETFTSIVSDETEALLDEEAPVEEVPVEEEPGEEVSVLDEQVTVDEAAELTPEQEWAQNGPDIAAGQSFSDWVQEGAGRGWDHGSAVSYWAQHRSDKDSGGTDDGTEVEAPVVDDTADGVAETEQSADDGDGRGNGDGRDNGDGRGNNGGHGDGNGRN